MVEKVKNPAVALDWQSGATAGVSASSREGRVKFTSNQPGLSNWARQVLTHAKQVGVHPYLSFFRVQAEGQVRVVDADDGPLHAGDLVCPLGTLERGRFRTLSLYRVPADPQEAGQPLFADGCFFPLGLEQERVSLVRVTRQLALALALYDRTGQPAIFVPPETNLVDVGRQVRDSFSGVRLSFVAEEDAEDVDEAKKAQTQLGDASVVTLPCEYAGEGGWSESLFLHIHGVDGLARLLLRSAGKLHTLCAPGERLTLPGWLIGDVLPFDRHGLLVFLAGPSGCGKSFLLASWVCSIVLGKSWFGHRVHAGKVLLFLGEGNGGFRRRLAAWCVAGGIEPTSVLASPNLLALESPFALDNPEQVDALVQECVDAGFLPSLIAIDTMPRFFAGDENAAQDVKLFTDGVEKLGRELHATVLAVTHTGKNDRVGDMKGSAELRGSADVQFWARKNEVGEIVLSCVKEKDSEGFADVRFTLRDVDLSDFVDTEGLLAGRDFGSRDLHSAVLGVASKPDGKPLKASRQAS